MFPNLNEIVTVTLRNRTTELADNMLRNSVLMERLNAMSKCTTLHNTICYAVEYALWTKSPKDYNAP